MEPIHVEFYPLPRKVKPWGWTVSFLPPKQDQFGRSTTLVDAMEEVRKIIGGETTNG